MRCCLEYDDFHPNPEVDCLGVVKELVNEFPSILINLFTIPCYKNAPLFENRSWCEDVRALIESNNICIAMHGTYHTQEEYKHYNYSTAVDKIKLGENILQAAGIDFVKVFRGPNWGMAEPSVDALCDLGYTHIYSHQSYADLNEYAINKGANICIYNWNLKDEYGKFERALSEGDPVIIHGHTHNVCSNGIAETYNKLSNFIKQYNPTFIKVNDYGC